MKKILSLFIVMLFSMCAMAQDGFKGTFKSEDSSVTLFLDLSEKSIVVPDMSDFGECYGYINGKTNGIWVFLKIKKQEDDKVLMRAVSERGDDAQDVELAVNKDGDIEMKLVSEQNIKLVSGNKYVKFPKVLVLKKLSR